MVQVPVLPKNNTDMKTILAAFLMFCIEVFFLNNDVVLPIVT